MRITVEMLNKVARDTVTQRSQADRGLIAIFLQGSLLSGNPIIGGAADIDLFFIHNENIAERREIVRMTDDIHLDIAHHSRSMYRNTRELRQDPHMGPTIYGGKILYDPQHFMDFTQASVRGQYNQPDNILSRAQIQSTKARDIWMSLQAIPAEPGIQESALYLQSVENIANAIASLNGPPLTERRFLLQFPERAEAIGNSGLYAGLMGLLGGSNLDPGIVHGWLPHWRDTFIAIPDGQTPPGLHPCRLNYYLLAFEAILGGSQPLAILWPLIRTWTKAVQLLPDSSEAISHWKEACDQLGLSGKSFPERLSALDIYLDRVEEILDEWAKRNGVSS